MARARKFKVMLAYAREFEFVEYEVEAESSDAAEREALWDFGRDPQFEDFNGIVQADWITDLTGDEETEAVAPEDEQEDTDA